MNDLFFPAVILVAALARGFYAALSIGFFQ
jgi:hypothetical protein